ncbi:hypothetical protein [Paenibacillus sp. HB172176]|uniref:hypothetical protein n=1 Tax=Paenibacillus sp. HB172176 TaxID=2493690 RepID=UPI001438D7D6|nr:hypothetical protein [Paenibacillus sp. HB172176]
MARRVGKKGYKWVALALAVVLSVQGIVYLVGNDSGRSADSVSALELEGGSEGSDDETIASDISNLTGVKADQVLELKQTGMSWTEVLEQLKTAEGGTTADRSNRSETLTGAGMQETVEALRAVGYSDEDILEARLLSERVEFQLESIAGDTGIEQTSALPNIEQETSKLERAALDVAQVYDASEAVRFMLQLEEKLGGREAVLDEYLLSLQLGIDLTLYAADSDSYEQQKTEQSAGLLPTEKITAARLEELMLSRINPIIASEDEEDALAAIQAESEVSAAAAMTPDNDAITDKQMSAPVPEVLNVKPVNPADSLRQEIDALNPNLRQRGAMK